MSFIVLSRYDNYIPAHIDMGRLKDHGIECWLKDENVVTIDPFLSIPVGGIKLMVDETDREKAIEILQTPEDNSQ